jgi:hypothetical protein
VPVETLSRFAKNNAGCRTAAQPTTGSGRSNTSVYKRYSVDRNGLNRLGACSWLTPTNSTPFFARARVHVALEASIAELTKALEAKRAALAELKAAIFS